MRIGLAVGEILYPLAGQSGVDERVHSSAADLRINGQTEKQIAAMLRSDYAKVYDRGNLLTTVTFSTTRKFETAWEAELFADDYDSTFPRTGTLILESLTPAGDVATRKVLLAVVDPPERRTVGATLMLSYTATGGEITDDALLPDPLTLWDTNSGNWEA